MIENSIVDGLIEANVSLSTRQAPAAKLYRSGTYSKLYVQIIFAVKDRQNLIPPEKREELHKFITGIVKKRNHQLISIFCMPDHLHLLIAYRPSSPLPDLVRDIKTASGKFINDSKWISGKFCWQEGYGAFSYSRSHLESVIRYILNQEKHHKKKSFKDEYIEFLEKFEIEFDEKYLFEWIW
jgi:putative transposase